MPQTLFLIDGHALAYRTYYALTRGSSSSRWITSKGEPTAGIFGFASVLMRIFEREQPDFLAVAFDTGKTFRDEMFPEYKATREKMPEDLRSQIERIRQLVDAFNLPRLEMDGYEADDVLGSAARFAVSQGLGVKIITGDRDLLQLVDERIIVNLPGRSLSEAKDYLPPDVKDYMGVHPNQVVDYKALVGDKSDNIPGIFGIGKKTAITLLEEYKTLENIYLHLDDILPRFRNKLVAGYEDALLSKKLATIVTDLPVELDLEMAQPDHFNPQRVRSLFRELEFYSLQRRLNDIEKLFGKRNLETRQLSLFNGQKQDFSPLTSEIESKAELDTLVIDTQKKLEAMINELSNAKIIAFDTETTSTNKMTADLVGISLSAEERKGYYIPIGHKSGLGQQLPMETVAVTMKKLLSNPKINKVGHNLKFDYIILSRYGIEVTPLSFDTMIAEWVCNPASRNLGLKNLSIMRLAHQMTEIEELIGKGKKQLSMAEIPITKVAPYAVDDACVVIRLLPLLKTELESTESMELFSEIEIPLIPVLAEMEMEGISLDTQFLSHMSDTLHNRLVRIKDQIYQMVGTTFNLNSPQQLSKALFETLGIKPPDRTRRTASGFFSTAASVLEALRGVHPVLDGVLEYRELSKLKSTYVDALPQQVNPVTERVHTSYNQTGSVTGRIASSNPNLQNIPIRTELGRQVRQAFIAQPGYRLLAVDYSQVELRIAAHMAKDEAMIATFRDGEDIHTTTAAAINNIDYNAVTKGQRRHAKAINFGLIYGMTPFGLTRTTDLTLAEAEDFVETYFDKYPGVKSYLDDIKIIAAERGYVETLLGRRRYFPGLINPSNRNVRNREEREAINAPIQGTAADIMKIAMLGVSKRLVESGLSTRMLLQVHDELVLECPQNELTDTIDLVQNVMENAYHLVVPLETEARIGPNWGELVEV